MSPKRLRNDFSIWAEKLLHHAVERVTSSFDARENPSSDTDASMASDDAVNHEKIRRETIARKLREKLLQDMNILEEASAWIDAHGEDAWLGMMGQLERISREVVDELLVDPQRARTRRKNPDASSVLARWDRVARGVAERVVDIMMEPADGSKKRGQRPSSDARAEVHEYTGGGASDE